MGRVPRSCSRRLRLIGALLLLRSLLRSNQENVLLVDLVLVHQGVAYPVQLEYNGERAVL